MYEANHIDSSLYRVSVASALDHITCAVSLPASLILCDSFCHYAVYRRHCAHVMAVLAES